MRSANQLERLTTGIRAHRGKAVRSENTFQGTRRPFLITGEEHQRWRQLPALIRNTTGAVHVVLLFVRHVRANPLSRATGRLQSASPFVSRYSKIWPAWGHRPPWTPVADPPHNATMETPSPPTASIFASNRLGARPNSADPPPSMACDLPRRGSSGEAAPRRPTLSSQYRSLL